MRTYVGLQEKGFNMSGYFIPACQLSQEVKSRLPKELVEFDRKYIGNGHKDNYDDMLNKVAEMEKKLVSIIKGKERKDYYGFGRTYESGIDLGERFTGLVSFSFGAG